MAYATSMRAAEALTYVTNVAGAYLPARDAVDIRLLREFDTVTCDPDTWYGWVTDISQVGGYPTLSGGTPYTDADNDGMEDGWERQHFGDLSRAGSTDSDGDGYTDIEEFLWGTDPAVRLEYYADLMTGPTAGQKPLAPTSLSGISD
jgi:hypothetical protein